MAAEDSPLSAFAVYPFALRAGVWVASNKVTASAVCGATACNAGGSSSSRTSLALSADGSTMAVGSPYNRFVLVFARNSSGGYNLQQSLFDPVDCFGGSFGSGFGWALSLSGDGTTLVVTAPGLGVTCGVTYVYTRAGAVWGAPARLRVAGFINGASITPNGPGASVAVSASGTTVVVGAPSDRAATGATWAFALAAGAWAPVGGKLVGKNVTTNPVAPTMQYQGSSVAVDATGGTIAVGGHNHAGRVGAAWLFKRVGGAFVQQVDQLSASTAGAVGVEYFANVALSGDGGQLIVGDRSSVGSAVRVYAGVGGAYVQQGNPLPASFTDLACSADGRLLAVHNVDMTVYSKCVV